MSITLVNASAPSFDRLPRLLLDVVVERLDLAASPTEPHARTVDELVHLSVDLRLRVLGILDGLQQVASLDTAAWRVEVELIGSKRKDAGVALERDMDARRGSRDSCRPDPSRPGSHAPDSRRHPP